MREYVRVCDVCQRIKAPCSKPASLLQPVLVPSGPWKQVMLDFVTGLPASTQEFNAILVFTDKFSRMTHLVPTHETCTAEDTAEMFLQHVYRLHGLPQSLLSDRDPRFTSNFWRAVHRALGVNLCLSIAFHPQTYGSTERTNQTIEDLLRAHCSAHQRDWSKYLHLVEFAFNHAENASTAQSPFYLNYGWHPETLLSMALPKADSNPAASDYLQTCFRAQEMARQQAHRAQNRQQLQYDAHHRLVEFQVGDLVLLATQNLDLPVRMCRKLSDRYIGPYKVLQRIGAVAYRLELPPHLRIHPVFHVALL